MQALDQLNKITDTLYQGENAAALIVLDLEEFKEILLEEAMEREALLSELEEIHDDMTEVYGVMDESLDDIEGKFIKIFADWQATLDRLNSHL